MEGNLEYIIKLIFRISLVYINKMLYIDVNNTNNK